MHHIGRLDEAKFAIPPGYEDHAAGFRRQTLVDAAVGAVHMGLNISQLEGDGRVDNHVHSYEKGFYVLEGAVEVNLDGRAYVLGAGDYAVAQVGVANAFRGAGRRARWLEMISPQPRARSVGEDTFFVEAAAWPKKVERPNFGDARTRFIGHFDEKQLPPPSYLQMDGYSGGNVEGISLKMMIDRTLGAQHQTMFTVEFQPGGAGNVHDHPFEESYFFVSGEADCELDGKKYVVRTGDVVWTSVGGTHGFFTKGDKPVRWIETQTPQPPGQQAFRFQRDWEYMRSHYGRT